MNPYHKSKGLEHIMKNSKRKNIYRSTNRAVKEQGPIVVNESTSDDIKSVQKGQKDSINNLTTDEIFRFMDLYFDRNMILYSHLYNSFNT